MAHLPRQPLPKNWSPARPTLTVHHYHRPRASFLAGLAIGMVAGLAFQPLIWWIMLRIYQR